MNWSQDYTVRSNARRAARAMGVDPDAVVACKDNTAFRFPLPDGAKAPAREEHEHPLDVPDCLKATSEERKADWKKNPPKRSKDDGPRPSAKATKPAKGKSAKRGKGRGRKGSSSAGYMEWLLAALKDPKGISTPEIMKHTGWLEHTARARIANVKIKHGLKIERVRVAGVNIYRPISKAAA